MTPTKEQPVSGAKDLVEQEVFARLCAKYTQRSDARQQSMGLQYMEAETHDLARFITTLLEAAGKMASALDNFVYSLTNDGKNDDRCLSVDHVALCVAIDTARQALRQYHEAHHGN